MIWFIIVAISLLDTLLLLSLPSRNSPSLLMLSPSPKTSLNSVSLSFFFWEERDRHYFPTGHPPPHINFSDTSRGPTTKCHTFLETSHDPWLISELKYLELVIWRITIKIVTIHFIFFLIWNIASPWHFWWIMIMIMIMVIIIMMIMIIIMMMMMIKKTLVLHLEMDPKMIDGGKNVIWVQKWVRGHERFPKRYDTWW